MNKSVEQLIEIHKHLPYFVPTRFLEIGSFDGTDSLLVKEHYDIPAYAIEANPIQFENRMLPMADKINVYCFLASDTDGERDFYSITSGPIGIQGKSSVYDENYYYTTRKSVIKVPSKRIDTFLKEQQINPNFAKIDVEGYAYQVLIGFGERIVDFEAIQIETESRALWVGQKVHKYVDEYLVSNGFRLAEKHTFNYQSDCLYIKE